jgi:hypothetical protein
MMADIAAVQEALPVRSEDPDGLRTYPYPDGSDRPLWSVTTVIGSTNSKPWIPKWYGRKATEHAIKHLEELARIKVIRGYDAAVLWGKEAADREREIKADVGTYIHNVVEALILWAASPGHSGRDIDLPELPTHLVDAPYAMGAEVYLPVPTVVAFMLDGFTNWVTDFSPAFLATEMPVYNPLLDIAGTLDMIFALTGFGIAPDGKTPIGLPGNVLTLCGDTKTGKWPEGTWKEQLAAYRRMPECMPSPLVGLQPMPPTEAGIVLHLRPEYPRGYCMMLVAGQDDITAWRRFKRAATVFTERQVIKDKPGIPFRPLRADGSMIGLRLCDMWAEGQGYGRALSPLRKALGAETELADMAEALTAEDLLGIRGVGPKILETTRMMLTSQGLALAGEEPPTTLTQKAA